MPTYPALVEGDPRTPVQVFRTVAATIGAAQTQVTNQILANGTFNGAVTVNVGLIQLSAAFQVIH